MRKVYRAWINQPSISHPLHQFHGKFCIVIDLGKPTVQIWFSEGSTHSMEVSKLCISEEKL